MFVSPDSHPAGRLLVSAAGGEADCWVWGSNVWNSYCGMILGLLRYKFRLSEFDSRFLRYEFPYE